MKNSAVSALVLLFLFVPAAAKQKGPEVFSGNLAFSDQELAGYLAGKELDPALLTINQADKLARAQRLIRQYYQDHGYPLARVELSQTPPDFSFQIMEGPRAKLGALQFVGNNYVESRELTKLAALEGYLDFNALEESLEKIRGHYRNQGFVRIAVGEPAVEVVEMEEGDHFPVPFSRSVRQRVRVTIPIKEGPRFRYGEIYYSGAQPESELKLPVPGDIYNEAALLEFRDQLVRAFRDEGKLLRQFQIFQDVQDQTAVVNLTIVVEPLPILTISKIEFTGNKRYPDSFYRRELTFEEASLLDARKLEASVQKLLSTGSLKSLSRDDVELVVDDQRLQAEVIFHLQERDRQGFFLSVGPDGWGGVQTSFFYSIANLIGLGEELGLDLNTGSHTTEFGLNLASRYLLGTQIPMSLGLRIFRRTTGLKLPGVDDAIRKLFNTDARGLQIAGSYQLRNDQELGLGLTAERTSGAFSGTHLAVAPSWKRTIRGPRGEMEDLRLAPRFSLFSGASDSRNLRADATYLRTFRSDPGHSKEFRFRLHAGHEIFFADPPPLFDRILKDETELRSFSFTSGPWALREGRAVPVGGDTLLTASADYRIPLGEQVAVVPFFDTGINLAVHDTDDLAIIDETNNIWKASLGSELRLQPFKKLPTARLIFSWNPLHLDTTFLTPNGLAHLRESPFSLRLSLIQD